MLSFSLNLSGKNISGGIITEFLQLDLVDSWLNEPKDETCKEHRLLMIKLFTRTKVFKLMDDKNEDWVKSTSWSQTRRETRNQ